MRLSVRASWIYAATAVAVAAVAGGCGGGGGTVLGTETASAKTLATFMAIPPSQVDDFSTEEFGHQMCYDLLNEGKSEDEAKDAVAAGLQAQLDRGADTNKGIAPSACEDAITDWKAKWEDTHDGTAMPGGDAEAARRNVRNAVPAVEAYNVENLGSADDVDSDASTTGYAGMDPALLHSFDVTINAGNVTVTNASTMTYCIESTVADEAWHKAGPSADLARGKCP
jgi:hypothetical protein